MPIYSYQCQACGHALEALQKISDKPLTDCPVCHQSELKKQLTAAGFRLSGSGWYETDFKKEKRKNIAGDQPSESKAKPETKPKPKEAAGSTPAA